MVERDVKSVLPVQAGCELFVCEKKTVIENFFNPVSIIFYPHKSDDVELAKQSLWLKFVNQKVCNFACLL